MQYKTKQKQFVLDCLKSNADEQLTAYDIVNRLKEKNIHIGLATVYRTLEALIEKGCIRKFNLPQSNSACFQYLHDCNSCNNHLHLKCKDCGKFIHLECDFANEIDKHIFQHHGFSVDNKSSVLYGVCENCEKNKN